MKIDVPLNEFPKDILQAEASVQQFLEENAGKSVIPVVWDLWSIFSLVIDSLVEFPYLHGLRPEGYGVNEEVITSKKITFRGVSTFAKGSLAEELKWFQVDISRGTDVLLYSFKLYRTSDDKYAGIYLGKTYKGWEVSSWL